jgi:hypothetical protein
MTLAKKREQQDEAFVKHLVDTHRTWNDAKEFLDIK